MPSETSLVKPTTTAALLLESVPFGYTMRPKITQVP
jgi:hypothetical protein